MLTREIFFLFFIKLSLATISVPVYFNARFNPNSAASKLVDLFSIDSSTSCACECIANSQCLTATYFGINQTCSLFSVQVNKQLLQIVVTVMDAKVFDFGNKIVSDTTISTTITTTTTACTNLFLNKTTYSVGASPISVVVTDVNGDNKPDIIVANNVADNVGVLLNVGNGTFLTQPTYTTDNGPYSVAVADVNGDNKPDIILANHGSNNVGILRNTGNGTFLGQTVYSTGSLSSPYSVAVVDVNGDNKPDIIVANSGSDQVGILVNTGNGTFTSQTTYSTGSGSSPYSVAVADVNGDNKPNIIVANLDSNNVGVFLNVGNGTFLSQTIYSTGASSSPCSAAVVDVNSDNKRDIIVANSGTNKVGVLLNIGNGTFLSQITYATGTSPYSIAVADMNSDNKPDIVVANYDSDTVSVLLHC